MTLTVKANLLRKGYPPPQHAGGASSKAKTTVTSADALSPAPGHATTSANSSGGSIVSICGGGNSLSGQEVPDNGGSVAQESVLKETGSARARPRRVGVVTRTSIKVARGPVDATGHDAGDGDGEAEAEGLENLEDARGGGGGGVSVHFRGDAGGGSKNEDGKGVGGGNETKEGMEIDVGHGQEEDEEDKEEQDDQQDEDEAEGEGIIEGDGEAEEGNKEILAADGAACFIPVGTRVVLVKVPEWLTGQRGGPKPLGVVTMEDLHLKTVSM